MLRKNKTDKIDTTLIVQYLMLNKYTLIKFQSIDIIKIKRLSRYRFEMIQQQIIIKIQLTACLDIILQNFLIILRVIFILKLLMLYLKNILMLKQLALFLKDNLLTLATQSIELLLLLYTIMKLFTTII